MFGQDVDLQVDSRPSTVGVKRSVVVGMRNDRKADDLAFDLCDRKADAIDRQRSLADDVARELRRNSNTQPPVVASE